MNPTAVVVAWLTAALGEAAASVASALYPERGFSQLVVSDGQTSPLPSEKASSERRARLALYCVGGRDGDVPNYVAAWELANAVEAAVDAVRNGGRPEAGGCRIVSAKVETAAAQFDLDTGFGQVVVTVSLVLSPL